jgi:CRISPR type I-E-associated protein CasB/Cse2
MTKQAVEAEARRTVEFLQRIREDRGALAALRSLWIPARETQAWPLLGRFGALENRTKREIVALYALHPAHTEDREDASMGAVCAKLSNKHNTFDLRFRRLLACDRRELPLHLRRVVMAAAALEISIDYTELYRDLQFWSDRVRLRWATDYYRRYQAKEEQEA